MQGNEQEGKKAELLSRIDRLRELLSEDAPASALTEAFDEVGRSLDGYTRPGRADGDMQTPAGEGEAPPGL
ncbi:hypothetical protein P12x_003038 [Tundrisphaera lichenicola]|uniref:hypothetical protein n=1 Tax=Tundrisphaera lichenicola TaxID=2029860 RepID=UPI003EBE5053